MVVCTSRSMSHDWYRTVPPNSPCFAVSSRKTLTLYRYVLSLFQDLTHTFAYEDFVHWDEDEEGMAFYFQYSRPGKKPRSVRIMSPFVSISVLACSARNAPDLMEVLEFTVGLMRCTNIFFCLFPPVQIHVRLCQTCLRRKRMERPGTLIARETRVSHELIAM